jgi:hypothetical protein
MSGSALRCIAKDSSNSIRNQFFALSRLIKIMPPLPSSASPHSFASLTSGKSRLVWSDELEGPKGAPPDPSKWGRERGGEGWGNHELMNALAFRSSLLPVAGSVSGVGDLGWGSVVHHHGGRTTYAPPIWVCKMHNYFVLLCFYGGGAGS